MPRPAVDSPALETKKVKKSSSQLHRIRADHLRSALIAALPHCVDVMMTQEGFLPPVPSDRDADDTFRSFIELAVQAQTFYVRASDRLTCLQVAVAPDAAQLAEPFSVVIARDDVKLLIWALSQSRTEWISIELIDEEDGRSWLDVQLAKGTRRKVEEVQMPCQRGVGVFEFDAFLGGIPTTIALTERIGFNPVYLGRFAAAVREYAMITSEDAGGAWYSIPGPLSPVRVDVPARRKERLGSRIVGALMPTTPE